MTKSNKEICLNRRLTVCESMVIGSGSSITEVIVGHPMWTLKTRTQNGSGLTMNPRILYRGVLPSMISTAPITSLQMGVDSGIQNLFFEGKMELSIYQQITCAFLAGVTSALVACPSERIMTQQSIIGGRFIDVGTLLIKQGGWRSLSTGFSNIAIRDGIFTVGYAVTSPVFKSYIKPHCRNDLEASLLSGICAGVSSAIVTQANDTIKTIQQSANQLQPMPVMDAVSKIYTTQGIAGFFKGGFWRGARVVSAITVIGTVKEKMEAHLYDIQP